MTAKTLGVYEKVDFPHFNLKNVEAKIDTGAYTGALHCTKVIEEQTPEGLVIHYSPFDHPEIKITSKDFYIDTVKSSNGDKEARYYIKTAIVVQGETYEIFLTLADRSNMKLPVIIGKRFIGQHNFLVDVNKKPTKSNTDLGKG